MAKTSIIQRELKRKLLVEKYAPKRKVLKDKIAVLTTKLTAENADAASDKDALFMEMLAVRAELDKIPRNAGEKRQRNRCELTGRPRGVYRKFKLCRNMLRKFTMMGFVPGLRKASW